ncbi:MAG TPA: fluoride efflux transporter CrcB [Steroidobacteraceae bacterium]|nr:fluoride efflux transporter CrcB [Steroidobacteraceae bacterium]
MNYLLVAIGSALGGVARFWCSTRVMAAVGGVFPWGTLTVNVVGSCLIGAALGLMEPGSRWALSDTARTYLNYFFMVGVLGGFTTFSAFSMQTLVLMRAGQGWQAGANVVLSVIACLVAVFIGYWLANR